MLCIICNENPEKVWPKRWQYWRDNGRFAEALCKLLGLPTFPYKADFQNAAYCSSCQKRVYNVYLMVRKWDKLQDEIDKLKARLKRDFQQSLRKGDSSSSASAGEEKGKSEKWGLLSESEPEARTKKWINAESIDDPSGSEMNLNTVVRIRILQRLEDMNRDCNCCCEPVDHRLPSKHGSCGIDAKQKMPMPGCGFPDCQDKECLVQWRKGTSKNKDERNGGDGSNSPESDWSSHPENECDDEQCNLCNSSEGPFTKKDGGGVGKQQSKPHELSEYCDDCPICKDEARKSKEKVANTNKPESCIKKEVAEASSETNEEFRFVEEAASDSFSPATRFKDCGKPCKISVSSPDKSENDSYLFDEDTTVPVKAEGDETTSSEKFTKNSKAKKSRFRCDNGNCTRTFLSQEDMDVHIKRHHEGIKCPFVCTQCGKAFQWRRELNAHVLKHSGEFAVCCHLCGRGFRTKQLFNVHLKTSHGGERKYKCSMCDKAFITESKLNTHLTIHTKIFPFICTICGKGFSAKTFLHFHMSKHMEANPYQCSTCEKVFSSPRNLRIHQYTHNNSHPFKCSICHAGVPSEVLLKKHMLKHNKEKASICFICDKKFRFPSSLKKHQKVHNGEKQFQCDFCDKAFTDRYKLTRHVRVHSQSFHCTQCQQSFTSSEYLSNHIVECHEKDTNNDSVCISIKSEKPTNEISEEFPLHLKESDEEEYKLPEINESLSAYLPEGFPTETSTSFLDNLNPEDDDLVVTALDLESFSKEELRMTAERGPVVVDLPKVKASESPVPNHNSIVLPDFQSLQRNSGRLKHNFSSFSFQ